jgi:hypothetical protein
MARDGWMLAFLPEERRTIYRMMLRNFHGIMEEIILA